MHCARPPSREGSILQADTCPTQAQVLLRSRSPQQEQASPWVTISNRYDELLQYRDEFREYCLHYRPDDFIKSKKDSKNKDGQSNERQAEPSPREEEDATPMLPSVLRRDLTQQFGTKAPEKLQRLLCMLRENQDVFQVFTQNVIRFSFDS